MNRDLDPQAYPNERSAEDLTDRGDDFTPEEDQDTEDTQDAGEAKKASLKKDDASSRKKSSRASDDEDEDEDDEDEDEDDEDEDEDEDEDDEDDEDEDDEDEDDEDDKPKKGAKKAHKGGATVPLSVLKRAQQRRREAEARAKELESRLRSIEESKSERQKEQLDRLNKQIDELYDKIEEARAEGDTKAAAKLQRELDNLRDKLTSSQAAALAARRALETQQTLAYNALVAELEAIDPRFDEESEEYDEDLVERVDDLTQGFEARGMPPADALRKALRYILGKDPFKESRRLARDLRRRAEEEEEARKKRLPPRKTDVKRNLDAKRKQPPDEPDARKEQPSRIDPRRLSDEDFDKLPKSKLRELRGDFF